MTYAALDPYIFDEADRFPYGLPRRRRSVTVTRSAAALAVAVSLAAALLAAPRTADPAGDEMRDASPETSRAALQVPSVRQARVSVLVAALPDPALLDPGLGLGAEPLPLSASHPLASSFVFAEPPVAVAEGEAPVGQAADDIPLPPDSSPLVENDAVPLPPEAPGGDAAIPVPTPRPEFAPLPPAPFVPRRHRLALAPEPPSAAASATPAPAESGGFLQKFFGLLKPSGPELGYAAPEDGLLGRLRGATFSPSRNYDRWTAVYDISAHTVYLPDGSRLEAHSGLGNRLDDPRFVAERNRGPTPPQMYDLQPREQLFHGVEALRLNPVGGGGVYGRTGLLAHTFMLGPNGDSNGCVSFRDYRAFLQAFKAGQVRRLAVVTRL